MVAACVYGSRQIRRLGVGAQPGRGAQPGHRRAQVRSVVHGLRASSRRRSASTSTRISCTACFGTRSPHPGRNRALVVVHRTHPRQSLEPGPLSIRIHRAPELLVLAVMDQFTRRLVGVGVHCGAVTGADLCRLFNARDSWSDHTATSQYGSRSTVRGASLCGESADS